MGKSIQTGNEKLVTIKEIANQLKVSVRVIQTYASKAGWTEHGKTTYLNEKQVTVILEAMKSKGGQKLNEAAQINLRSTETDLSIDAQIAMAEREARFAAERAKELWKTKAERLEAELENVKAQSERTENVASWLIKGHQRLGEEVIEKFYGGELPYWAK
jgi:hypothetical protein